EFNSFISTLGYSLPAGPGAVIKPKHFQKLVERIQGKPEERAIAMLMLRTMQKARYDAGDLGHFGLAAEHYTHFTSPIRRYPDLVVHRSLRDQRLGRGGEEKLREREGEVPDIARHPAGMGRRGNEAGGGLVEGKKVRFMADKVGDEFEGFIIGVAPFGLFVELIEHFVEGLVHISTMADDYYRYDERGHALKGEHTEKLYRLGDRVKVQVTRVDMERRQVELALADVLDRVRESERHRGPRKSRITSKRAQGRARDNRGRNQRPGRRERSMKKQARKRRR